MYLPRVITPIRTYPPAGWACILIPNSNGGRLRSLKCLIVKFSDACESAISICVLEQNRLLRQALVQRIRKWTSFAVLGDCAAENN